MSNEVLRRHVENLRANAAETKARADDNPEDWLLQSIATSQQNAVVEAARQLSLAEVGPADVALEWRLVGQRLKFGELPLSLLAKLADPLNKLLLRAAYFARNKAEPQHGVGEDLANELDLRLSGLAPGSTRIFLAGNATPDTTGNSALSEGIEHLLDALISADDFQAFYERIGDLGESASHALRDTLRALEQEEASVEVIWRTPTGTRTWSGPYDQVVRLRSLLDGVSEPTIRQAEVAGAVEVLNANGTIRLTDSFGQKKSVRFNPKNQTDQVSSLRLGQHVTLSVTERVVLDPISGNEVSQYRLNRPAGLIQ